MSSTDTDPHVCSPIQPAVNPSTESGFKPDLGEGAYGGDPHSISPTSDSVDNLSLEVQFEDRSSRHPSEISSLSYQNLLDDGEGSGNILSRHESEDSADSFPPDYGDSFIQEESIRSELQDLPGFISEKYQKEALASSAANCINMTNGENNLVSGQSVTMMENEVQMRQARTDSEQTNDEKKRNSLEIRNNIPTVGEVKNYENDTDRVIYNSQGAKPKIRKQSPGLACRVGEGSTGSGSDREGSVTEGEGEWINKQRSPRSSRERDTLSVERGVNSHHHVRNASDGMEDISLQQEEEVVRLVKIANVRPTCLIQPHVRESPDLSQPKGTANHENIEGNEANYRLVAHGKENPFNAGQGNEVENEYDYVKYARIQDGDSYVGMRLAYSTMEDSKRSSLALNGYPNDSGDNSQENSPEKSVLHQKHDLLCNTLQNVSEDALTEIPLDVVDSPCLEDKQAFSLSPENTECDSIEVESVSSEKSNMGMPNVEDGLSSSQCSDIEEGPPPLASHKSPTAILHKKQKAELTQELLNLEREYGEIDRKPKEIDAEAIMEDLKAKREALDVAIADIKSAIQSSKGVALKSPGKDEAGEEEPVWVKR